MQTFLLKGSTAGSTALVRTHGTLDYSYFHKEHPASHDWLLKQHFPSSCTTGSGRSADPSSSQFVPARIVKNVCEGFLLRTKGCRNHPESSAERIALNYTSFQTRAPCKSFRKTVAKAPAVAAVPAVPTPAQVILKSGYEGFLMRAKAFSPW